VVLLGLALSADAAVAADLASPILDSSSLQGVQPIFEVASEQPLLENVARYARYFVTVMLGTGYMITKPIQGLFKNPITGVLGTVGLIAFALLIKYTVELMVSVPRTPTHNCTR
jgi:hypothetical protein